MKVFKKKLKEGLLNQLPKLTLLVLIIGIVGLFSFKNSIFELPFEGFFDSIEDSEKIYKEEVKRDGPVFTIENAIEEIEDDLVSDRKCPAFVRTVPFNDPGPTANYPFHLRSAISVQAFEGNCISGLVPCAYVGSIFVATRPGQSGDYRIITPNGIIDLPNVNGVESYTFGTPTNPYTIQCSFFQDFILQAKNPTTGQWKFVRRFRFICNPCCIPPFPPNN